ncbi:MAG TPA: endolytic transglycosylase MltG [Candidatus Kapabacteria bacterium]|nr:endolytic transglycosylase MltG [Candidatus Kapabacteria bacterium]
MRRLLFLVLLGTALIGVWFVYSEIHTATAQDSGVVTFEVQSAESVPSLGERLEKEHIVRHAWLFERYLAWKGMDRKIQAGAYTVTPPITLARVVQSLGNVEHIERTITIIPGWNLRDIAEYLEKEGFGTQEEVFVITGTPASVTDTPTFSSNAWILAQKPKNVSLEGYLAPDTYRVYADADIEDIIELLIDEREKQLTPFKEVIEKSGHSVHEILTMASIIEREVRDPEDKAKVSDLFWRRLEMGWGFQADSTVHYAVGKKGNVFTTKEDRNTASLWNTYKHAGLPPGPISSPSLSSIQAALAPVKNDAWYFLTTAEGEVKYAKTNDEHNRNRALYLR